MITISVTRYKEPNDLFYQTLESLALQEDIDAQVLVLDQHYDADTEHYCQQLSHDRITLIYSVIEARNLCYARNIAIQRCNTAILLYIDSDAIATPHWAAELTKTLQHPSVAVAWGKILPIYHAKPLYISKYSRAQSLYSLLDLGDGEHCSHKVVWANFGINIQRIWARVFFDEQFARRKWMLISWDENDFVKKVIALWHAVRYNWNAVVQHQILPERITYTWIRRRMYYQWYSKYISGSKPVVVWFTHDTKDIRYYCFLLLFALPWLCWFVRWIIQKKSV